jgi:hypothetical protein
MQSQRRLTKGYPKAASNVDIWGQMVYLSSNLTDVDEALFKWHKFLLKIEK